MQKLCLYHNTDKNHFYLAYCLNYLHNTIGCKKQIHQLRRKNYFDIKSLIKRYEIDECRSPKSQKTVWLLE